MAKFIESRGGRQIETGFSFMDTSRVRIGESLPLMATEQFADYAVDTVGRLTPDLPPEKKESWAETSSYIKGRLEETRTDEGNSQFSQYQAPETIVFDPSDNLQFAEAASAIAESLHNEAGDVPVHYKNNPFIPLDNGDVSVGGEYEVDKDTFYDLTAYVIHGGLMGWGEKGATPAIKESASKLDQILHPKDLDLPKE